VTFLGSDVPAIEPVEVLRATAASTLEVSAAIVGGVAAAAVVVLIVLALRRGGRQPTRLAWALACVASVSQIGLGLADAGSDGLTATLADRRGLAVLARLAALGAAAAVDASSRRGRLSGGERRVALVGLGALAAVSLPLAVPAAGTFAGLLAAIGLTAAAAVVVSIALVAAARAAITGPAVTLAVALAVGGGLGVLTLPERAPPYHAERLRDAGAALDITVAPVGPGRNEIHVYAWDDEDRPLAVDSIEATVSNAGASSGTAMFAVSPNHHLSYQLDLPEGGPWQLDVTAVLADGGSLRVSTTLEEP